MEDEESKEEVEEPEEDEVEIIEEGYEPLETIIETTSVPKYPQPNIDENFSPSLKSQPLVSDPILETELQDVPTPTTTGTQPTAENEPSYSSDTYQEIRSQEEPGYPRPIQPAAQGVLSSSAHLIQSQFDTIPRAMQQINRMPDDVEKIRTGNKEYKTEFEEKKRDRRRF
jgi:hypothetical protein